MLAVGAGARSGGVVEVAAHADGGRRAAAQGAQGEVAGPGVPLVAAVIEMGVAVAVTMAMAMAAAVAVAVAMTVVEMAVAVAVFPAQGEEAAAVHPRAAAAAVVSRCQ
ncbi:MAG: hypothetical protein QOF15_2476 [Mycobacterium sp.]|nr:hypothetical protein [Mycobacterium sp.]